MGYRRMTKENVYEILRRWHAGKACHGLLLLRGVTGKRFENHIGMLC